MCKLPAWRVLLCRVQRGPNVCLCTEAVHTRAVLGESNRGIACRHVHSLHRKPPPFADGILLQSSVSFRTAVCWRQQSPKLLAGHCLPKSIMSALALIMGFSLLHWVCSPLFLSPKVCTADFKLNSGHLGLCAGGKAENHLDPGLWHVEVTCSPSMQAVMAQIFELFEGNTQDVLTKVSAGIPETELWQAYGVDIKGRLENSNGVMITKSSRGTVQGIYRFFALNEGKPCTCPRSVEASESSVNALEPARSGKLCFTLWVDLQSRRSWKVKGFAWGALQGGHAFRGV